MKNLIFLLLLLPFGGLAQIREEYVSEIPANCKTYPIKNKRFSEYYGEFPFIQIKDSVTGKLKTIKNEKFIESVIHEYYNDSYIETQNGYSLGNTYFHISAPPVALSLDSLEDGTYLYYYETVAYEEGDGDTLKFLENALCGIVPIKNNLLHGEVILYYPNGLLMERITFENGRRNGSFFFQDITVSDPTKKVFYRDYFSTESGTFKDDIIEGKYTKTIISKLQNGPVLEETETTHFKNKMRHGEYESQVNGKTFEKGTYRNGIAIGKWELYQWQGEYGNSKLVPKLIFTIAENPAVYSGVFYHRKGVKEPNTEFNPFISFPINGSLGGYHYLYNSLDQFPVQLSSLKPSNTEASDISSYYKAIDCIVDSIGTNAASYNEYEWRSANHYTSAKRYVGFSEIEDSCGVVFPFENMSIYHPNGQLFLKYDFSQPEDLYKTILYHSNGKIQNQIVFNQQTWDFEESWFDEKGKLKEKYISNSAGDRLEQVFPVTKMERNGRKYVLLSESWNYDNTTKIDQNSSEIYTYSEKLNEKFETVYLHTYLPLKKKGLIVERSDFSAKIDHNTHYEFSNDYKSVTLHDSIHIGGLWITSDTVINFKQEDLIQYYLPVRNNDQLEPAALGHVYKEMFSRQNIHLSDKLFSGQLTIQLSDDSKQQISQSKKGVSLKLNQREFYKIRSFLTQTAGNKPFFDTYAPTNRRLMNIPENKQEIDNLASYRLSKIQLVFEQGEIQKASLFAENGFPLQEIDFKKGNMKKYNEYPAIGFRDPNYRDSIYSYLSEDETFNQTQNHRITFNPKGDTTYSAQYTKGSDLVQFKENYLNRSASWVTQNGNITRFQLLNNETNKIEQRYNPENHSVEVFNSGTPNQIITYLSKINVQDSIYCLDSLGQILRKQYFVNGEGKEFIYQEGILQSRMRYDSIAHWKFLSRERPLDRNRLNEISNNYLDNLSNNNSIFVTKYDIYGKTIEEGRLVDHVKTGIWKYHYPQTLGEFTVSYIDTIVKSDKFNKVIPLYYDVFGNDPAEIPAQKATISFFDENSNMRSKGILYEFDSEYSCLHNDYTEQYIIEYSFYNGKPTEGTSYNIVNYYPNGNKMNEGTIVNGKPEGLWKWYHSDGLLYEVGKYQQGIREGRWLKGDLSKVRFTGEMCLDPSSSDFKEIMKFIQVTVEYYESGLKTHSEFHELEVE